MAYNANKIRHHEYGTSDPANQIRRRDFGRTYPAEKIGRHEFGCTYPAEKIRRRESGYTYPANEIGRHDYELGFLNQSIALRIAKRYLSVHSFDLLYFFFAIYR